MKRDPVARAFAMVAVAMAVLTGTAASVAPVELDLWAMGAEGEAAATLVRSFEVAHPDVGVRVQQVPWSAAHEKLLTAFVGDALPDVVQVGSTWVPELVALGALLPATLPDAVDEFPGVRTAHSVDGRPYAIPWYVDTRVLFYRTDRLAAAGVSSVPTTWDGWAEVFRRVSDPPARYGLFTSTTDWWLPMILATQHGASVLDAHAEHGRFAAPGARAALARYVALFRDGLAPAAGGAEIANLYQDFATGFFAVFPSGPWDLGEVARRMPVSLADRWATAPMPGLVAGEAGLSIVGGAGLAVPATTRHPALAWALAHHLAEPAQQLALHRLTGDLPARRSAWAQGGLRTDARRETFWRQLEHVAPVPAVAEWERIADALGRRLDRVIRDETELDAALIALDAEVDGILEKRRWMRSRGRLP